MKKYKRFFTLLSFYSVFTFRINEDLGTLDWNYGEVPSLVVMQLMEGLTTSGPRGEVKPALAQNWYTNNKGKTWIFTIDKKATWSDGKPVCAQDFVDSWQRALSSETASPFAHYFYFIKNAEKFHNQKIDASLLGIRTSQCDTLIVEMEDANSFFPLVTSHWVYFPIRKDLLGKYGHTFFTQKHLVTTGPYILKEWLKDQYFLLVANSHYKFQTPQLKTIKALIVNDDHTALNLFRTKKIQWMKDIPFTERPSLIQDKRLLKSQAYIGYFLGFNTQLPPFNDVTARCALAQALDKKQIPLILNGSEIPAQTWVPPLLLSPLHTKSISPLFDPLNAKKLLAKSSLSQKKELDLEYYVKDIHTPIMEWIQNQIQTNLSLQVRLKPMEGKAYWSHLATNPPPLFLSGTTAWFSDAYPFLAELTSSSHANWGRFKSKKYDTAVLQLKGHVSSDIKNKLITRAQQELLAEQCAIIPLYFRGHLALGDPYCTHLELNPLSYIYFKNVQCH